MIPHEPPNSGSTTGICFQPSESECFPRASRNSPKTINSCHTADITPTHGPLILPRRWVRPNGGCSKRILSLFPLSLSHCLPFTPPHDGVISVLRLLGTHRAEQTEFFRLLPPCSQICIDSSTPVSRVLHVFVDYFTTHQFWGSFHIELEQVS